MTENNIKDRALGAFIGLAVGDSLGSPVEFKEPGEFEPVTEMRPSGVWRTPAGYWTDDTSMALCLADSILANNKIDQIDLIDRFSRWYRYGENSSTGRCFDIGNTTRRAIERWIQIKQYLPAEDYYYLNGNGSIMRLSPVATRWWNDHEYLLTAAVEQGITTHGASECVDACKELADYLGRAIRGEDIHTELKEFSQQWNNKRIPNTGYVVDTMIAAKWAVGSSNSFNEAVLKAVNLGGDADTIGAVTAQISGAIWGLGSIRKSWLNDLYDYDRLLNLATKLFDMA